MVERNFSRELTAIWEPRDAAMQEALEALDALEDSYAQANRTIAAQAEVIAKLREALDTIAGVIALAEGK